MGDEKRQVWVVLNHETDDVHAYAATDDGFGACADEVIRLEGAETDEEVEDVVRLLEDEHEFCSDRCYARLVTVEER